MRNEFVMENMHIHSKYSHDSEMEIDKITEILVSNGIRYAAITDDIDFGKEDIKEVSSKIKIRNLEIDSLNEKYKGKIKLLKGIEVDSPHRHAKEFKEISTLDIDVIIGSVHNIPKAKSELEERNFTYQYYNEILDMVKFGKIDVVGHIDFINSLYNNDFCDYSILGKILSAIRYSDMVLEINTSAERICHQMYFPHQDKLKKYRQFKSEITIGTDARTYDELIINPLKIQYLVKELGFNPIAFEKRKKKYLNPPTYH